jgi:hypothetical protein
LDIVGDSNVDPITNSGSSSSSRFADTALVGRAMRSDKRTTGSAGIWADLSGIRVGPIDNGWMISSMSTVNQKDWGDIRMDGSDDTA